jgi:mRNA-degrading endonuclease RelE of RelBE toxin-antitoxin system
MAWDVRIATEARKNLKKVPKGVDEIFQLLLKEIALAGPVQNSWPNYSKITQVSHQVVTDNYLIIALNSHQ